VALGEGTHGTSEFFRMKHRLVEFLASEMDFTVFAIEANMPECEVLNRYVLNGEGDPGEGLDGIYFWTWNTREVLAMIEWMREYNASGSGRIEFRGFDMQTPSVAMMEVIAFLAKADPEYRVQAEEAYTAVSAIYEIRRRSGQRSPSAEDTERYITLSQEVLDYLIQSREAYCRRLPAEEVEWAIQEARIVRQSAEPAHRDRSMAENVDWLLAHHPPGTRIVLWAHNGHVHEQYPAMGWYLADRHGADYYTMGFCFSEGDYTAVGPDGLTTYVAGPPVAGSVEALFGRTGLPRFILDLQAAEAGSPASGWLHTPRPFRSIGSMAIENPFYPVAPAKEYDALIWIARTTHSILMHPPGG
jgi:erythromycin esterase